MITAVDSNLLIGVLSGTDVESRTALRAIMRTGSEGPLLLPITAGTYFRQYLKRGGNRARILPDFVIAAQASRYADRLLTDDTRFSHSVFPALVVVRTNEFT